MSDVGIKTISPKEMRLSTRAGPTRERLKKRVKSTHGSSPRLSPKIPSLSRLTSPRRDPDSLSRGRKVSHKPGPVCVGFL